MSSSFPLKLNLFYFRICGNYPMIMLYNYIIMLTFNICYSEALGIDPFNRTTNSKLYFNRATVHAKLGKLENSIDDCSKAIDLDNTYIKAYLRLIFHFIFLKNN